MMRFFVLVSLLSLVSAHVVRSKRDTQVELIEAVEKLKDKSTDEIYEAVIIPDWEEVGNGLEKRIGANPDFSEKAHQILNNEKLSRKQVKEEFMKLIDEQPVETKELLTDVTHQVEGTVAEIKLRLTTVIKELSQLANEIEEILQDKDLTLKQTFEKARAAESKFDVATIRAYKAVLATTFLTVMDESDMPVSIHITEVHELNHHN